MKEETAKYLESLSLPEIADKLNRLHASIRNIHDGVIKNRVVNGVAVQKSFEIIHRCVDELYLVFATKAGIDPANKIGVSARFEKELEIFTANQAAQIERHWNSLAQIGAVFSPIRDTSLAIEVLEIYVKNASPDSLPVLFCRYHNSGMFVGIGKQQAQRFVLLDKKPLYQSPEESGFIKAPFRYDEENQGKNPITVPGTVFFYKGEKGDPRNSNWETFYCVYRPGQKHQIAVARNRRLPQVAEFSPADSDKVFIIDELLPKFVMRDGEYSEVPDLDLSKHP